MGNPLHTTLNLLERSRNRAAAPILAAALRSKHGDIRAGAIAAMVERRDPACHTDLLRRFHDLGDADRLALSEVLIRSSHQMRSALHEAILSDEDHLCESACHTMLLGRIYDHLPMLVAIAENRLRSHSDQAAATIIRLSRMLRQELSGEQRQPSRDPFFVRRQVLPSLERAVLRYGEHQRLEIVDAFLLVVPPTNATLNQILSSSAQPCHKPVVASLRTSAVTAIVELVTQLLHDTNLPSLVLDIIAERADRKFVAYLLHHVGSPASLRVLDNMRRVRRIAWLQQQRHVLVDLDGPAQAAAVEIALASGIDRDEVFELLALLLTCGKPAGRRAGCEGLTRYHDQRADQLVVDTLLDSEPAVRAAAVKQLRGRGLLDAMEKLVALIDDPQPEVREAARASLAEFSFVRYEALYDSLDAATRTSTGRLVAKVDPSAAERLATMLSAPSPSTKRHGLELTISMQAADAVSGLLLGLLHDSDLAVRTEAAVALGDCRHSDVLPELRQAERDPHRQVREAAARSSERINQRLDTVPISSVASGTAQ